MNAKQRAEAWAIDQYDPNNWLEIPDFNIEPRDESFQGFAFPIVSPTPTGYALRLLIREHVVTARALGQRHFESLKDLKGKWAEVLDPGSGGEMKNLESLPHTVATLYMSAMDSASRALGHALNTGKGSTERCLNEIGHCAVIFRLALFRMEWATPDIEDAQNIRAALKAIATKGALAKLANDPKQQEKQSVKECWVAWQTQPNRYKGNAAFARDMLGKYESLRSQPVIERWCREWAAANATSPAG